MFAEFSTSCLSFQHDVRRNKKRLWCNKCAVIKTVTTWKSFLECFDDATDTTIWISSCYRLLPKFDWVFSTAIQNNFFLKSIINSCPSVTKPILSGQMRHCISMWFDIAKMCCIAVYFCWDINGHFLLRYFGHWNIWVICLSCVETHCNSVCILKSGVFGWNAL